LPASVASGRAPYREWWVENETPELCAFLTSLATIDNDATSHRLLLANDSPKSIIVWVVSTNEFGDALCHLDLKLRTEFPSST
jgi:hypothetical protein